MTNQNPLRAVVIGCGKRGRRHASDLAAYGAQVVAVADPVAEAGCALAELHMGAKVYADYNQMLREEEPDLISVCTWPEFHYQNVLDAARSGARAVHSEKPMAVSWRQAVEMHQVCEELGVQLTFAHQRRFGAAYVKARELLQSGAIGNVHHIEGFCDNLYDWGTHWFDMMFFWNGETPAQWVIGQADFSGTKAVFGATMETAGFSYIRFENSVHGMLATGKDFGTEWVARILGSDGVIEIANEKASGGPIRMLRSAGAGWEAPVLDGLPHGHVAECEAAMRDVIGSLMTGREPQLSSRKAVRATELIFATYESARRGERVSLPLQAENASLEIMLQARPKN